MVHYKIADAFKNARVHVPSSVRIQYAWENMEGKVITNVLTATQLHNDWFGECTFCPENSAPVLSLAISSPTEIASFTPDMLENLTFEDLMEQIKKNWKFKKRKEIV